MRTGRGFGSTTVVLALTLVSCDCGGTATTRGDGGAGDAASTDVGPRRDTSRPPPTAFEAELWYSVDDLLVRIAIDRGDGSVADVQSSTIVGGLEVGQNAITMLDDGSLLGARLSQADDQSHFYYVADPPRDGSDVTVDRLGVMPDGLMIEGLYSDCDGRLYAMDTGEDDTNSNGNRLLRFTGDVLSGDFTFAVVSDLSMAVVADIDDMGPGITGNEITDNPGLAIDTSDIYDFNYETGTGTRVAMGGTWGIHALGGDLFTDGISRLYVLSRDAELFEVEPTTFTLSDVLVTGPTPGEGDAGWTGLAGPLTECETGFTLI
jgi:hypothetical protein